MAEQIRSGNVVRTLVEFYDFDYLENVVSLLYEDYDFVTYVYFKSSNEPGKLGREGLERFLKEKIGMKANFLKIEENTIGSALNAFEKMISDGGVYEFDITGGSSVFIAAVGALLEREGGNRVSAHEYNPAKGKRTFSCPGNGTISFRREPLQLTFSDVLLMRGVDRVEPEKAIQYDLDQDNLRGEIVRLWDAIRDKLSAWNSLMTLPTEYTHGWTSIHVQKKMNVWQYQAVKDLLDTLTAKGIFQNLNKSHQGKSVLVTYRMNIPETACFLYETGGIILEMLTYLAAENSGLFFDCCTGVKLDWVERDVVTQDPYNEIDAVMTRGHIPYFVSCKNTAIKNDYLYEILTMTRHFGGRYAVPALVTTMDCSAAIQTRAREMGILLIDRVRKMTMEEFTNKLKKLI